MSEAYDVTKIKPAIKPAQLLSSKSGKGGAAPATQSPAEIAEAVKALQQELAELRKLVRAGGPVSPLIQN